MCVELRVKMPFIHSHALYISEVVLAGQNLTLDKIVIQDHQHCGIMYVYFFSSDSNIPTKDFQTGTREGTLDVRITTSQNQI